MKKSKVTTEDLAIMVQKGFEDLGGRMDRGFTEVKEWQKLTDGRLDAIEMELIDIKKKLATVIDRREFEILKDRVNNLERRLEAALNKKK